MHCREVREFLTGEIDPAPHLADEVERHLVGCSGCRSLALLERALLETARNGSVPPIPEEFTSGVLTAWRRETAFEATFHPALQPFAVALAALRRAYRDTMAALAISFEYTGRAVLWSLKGASTTRAPLPLPSHPV